MRRVGKTFVGLRIREEYEQKTIGRRYGIPTRDHQRSRGTLTPSCRGRPQRCFGGYAERLYKRSCESSHRSFESMYTQCYSYAIMTNLHGYVIFTTKNRFTVIELFELGLCWKFVLHVFTTNRIFSRKNNFKLKRKKRLNNFSYILS